MSLSLDSQQLSTIRDQARTLVQRAGDHEDDLEALVAAADLRVQQAEEALADALDVAQGRLDHLQALLSTQLRRSHDGAVAARRVWTRAREQRMASDLLLTHLDRSFNTDASDQRLHRHDGVLVVDDYQEVREFVAVVLRAGGFVVRTAANGLEGLLTAYEMRPSVIVMDVTMPVLDGIEATRLIKASEATSHAQVIAYTGNQTLDNGLVQRLFAAVVHKPASPSVILATVQALARG
jgi:two-component system cell cycle response regulator DivK